MVRQSSLGPAALSIALFAATWLVAPSAQAATLAGQLTDALTGTPISGATVRVLGTTRTTTTGPDGRWSFELPPGTYELSVQKRLGARHHRFRLVRQRVPQHKPADTTIATTYFLERGADLRSTPRAAPVRRPDAPSDRDRGPVTLDRPPPAFDPTGATLSEMPSTSIRVARRREKDNCNNEIVAIEEMPLDEYVRGVLPPEIGVFKGLENAEEIYKAFALAAKSYGLYFTLVYDSENRRRVGEPKPPDGREWFHIDDTPCNQRYSDKRLSITTQAANSQGGRILVKRGAPDTLERFEYAASCGEHGTRPAYQQSIVEDSPPTQSCVNGWCGHDDCAGHADHPAVSGSDTCLVRGFCQWGAAEWAEAGKDYRWILDHYQPNLQVEQVWRSPGTTQLKGYVYTDPSDIPGSAVPGATVQFGESTVQTDAQGQYSFEDLESKRRSETVTVSHPEYGETNRTVLILPDRTNWASVLLEADEPAATTDAGDADATGAEPGVDTGGANGSSGVGCGCRTGARSSSDLPMSVLFLACVLGLRVRRRS